MGMLFFPLLSASFPKDKAVYLQVLILFVVMAGISVISYQLVFFGAPQIASIAFLVAFTPTATAAPVVISLFKKNVDYVILAVVITNCLVAFFIPFILPLIVPGNDNISVVNALMSTLMIVLIPLAISQVIKKISSKLAKTLSSRKNIPFYIWLIVLYLATSKASLYLLSSSTSLLTILEIALISLILCILNFIIGKYIGGKKYYKEASQSLGQKNTMLMTWVALEYISPLAVLGPVFYLIFQNIYISILLRDSKGINSTF
jgi:BASS family bile acid:Na+ symporter